MGTRNLDDLSTALRPKVIEVLARLAERGIPVMIVQTLRTMAEHQANLKAGTSAAVLSKHLPRVLRGYPLSDADAQKADAIDLAPYEIFALHGPDKLQWDADDPAFKAIGEFGEAQGLRWGGRWKTPRDPGHLELVLHPPVTTVQA